MEGTIFEKNGKMYFSLKNSGAAAGLHRKIFRSFDLYWEDSAFRSANYRDLKNKKGDPLCRYYLNGSLCPRRPCRFKHIDTDSHKKKFPRRLKDLSLKKKNLSALFDPSPTPEVTEVEDEIKQDLTTVPERSFDFEESITNEEKVKETAVQIKLQRRLGGDREVEVILPAPSPFFMIGKIDLLNEKECTIIEVKHAKRFWQAIGQVTCYAASIKKKGGKGFDNYSRRIHFFNCTTESGVCAEKEMGRKLYNDIEWTCECDTK